eukprot:g4722.t1
MLVFCCLGRQRKRIAMSIPWGRWRLCVHVRVVDVLLLLFALLAASTTRFSVVEAGGGAEDPFPYLHGYNSSGHTKITASPDPLHTYTWNESVDKGTLQVFYLKPVRSEASSSAIYQRSDGAIVVNGTGSIMFDFGQENAGWLEFDAPDLPVNIISSIFASISEYTEPAVVNAGPTSPNKTAVPKRYVNDENGTITYRLELNDELYEGVRYGWIHVLSISAPWHITAVRLVCQAKPQGYLGGFRSSSLRLEQMWWTGAYTVRLNLMQDYFGSILMDRGDRYSWTGDAHTIQRTAYVAFGDIDFILSNINRTSCATCSNGIEAYALYWVLSVCDFYRNAANGADALLIFAGNATEKLDRALAIYGASPSLAFVGGDERFGSYFEDPSIVGNQRTYQYLTLWACLDFASVAAAAAKLGPKYAALSTIAVKYLRSANEKIAAIRNGTGPYDSAAGSKRGGEEWWAALDSLSAAMAINAGFATDDEVRSIVATFFDTDNDDDITVFTPFNQFFICRALFEVGRYNLALRAMELVWGGMLDLGATSFWEVFNPQWGASASVAKGPTPVPNGQNGYTSLCHPWAGGVTALLTEYVLGLRFVELGRVWELRVPIDDDGDIGTIALPYVVNGSHPNGLLVSRRYDGESKIVITVSSRHPKSSGKLLVPRLRRRGGHAAMEVLSDIRLGVGQQERASVYSREGKEDIDKDAYVEVNRLRCGAEIGSCSFEISYRVRDDDPSHVQKRRHVDRRDRISAVRFLGRDDATSGSWRSKYGSLGYSLFSFDESGGSRVRLPDFVSGVRAHRGDQPVQNVTWSRDAGGRAALESPEEGGGVVSRCSADEQSERVSAVHRCRHIYRHEDTASRVSVLR